MLRNPLNFNLADNSLTTQNPLSGSSFGDVRGGGARLSFGGINSGPPWLPWALLAAAGLGLGYFIYRQTKRS